MLIIAGKAAAKVNFTTRDLRWTNCCLFSSLTACEHIMNMFEKKKVTTPMTSYCFSQLFQHLATPLTAAPPPPPFVPLSSHSSPQTVNSLPSVITMSNGSFLHAPRVKTLLLWHFLTKNRGGEAQGACGDGWVMRSGWGGVRWSLPFCRLTDLQTRGCVKAAVLFSVALQSVSSASTRKVNKCFLTLVGFSFPQTSRISFLTRADETWVTSQS